MKRQMVPLATSSAVNCDAAIEAAVLGCAVVVDPCSAAAPVGHTNIEGIREPIYPDRTEWLRSIAASQFTAEEVANGTIWRFIGGAHVGPVS